MIDLELAMENSDTVRRLPYTHDELRRLLDPRSIAVVGASARVGSFGERTVENLKDFDGEVLLINPRYAEIGVRPCYPSLSALPTVPDCIVIGVGAPDVEQVIREAVLLGVGGAIIYSSGFAETGSPEGEALQARLVELVRGTKTRLIGPNCIGIFNHVSRARMSFTVLDAPSSAGRRAVGLVSQSGALGTALGQASHRGAAISHILTAGNSSDVDVADLVSYLADDPNCHAIACLFEGLSYPQRLLLAARRAWENDKPVVVYKMATGAVGSAAAMSHTGSLAGSAEFYRAAFESAGMIQVEQPEDLIEVATFFAKAPARPVATGAAIISVSGGAGVIAADKAELRGVSLPTFSADTEASLSKIIPAFGSPKNPCDITAELLKKPEMLSFVADTILAEPEVGTIIYPHPFARDGASERMQILAEACRQHGKMFCTVWLSGWTDGPGAAEAEANPDLALFRSMDVCFATLAAWQERAERHDRETVGALLPWSGAAPARALLTAEEGKVIGEAKAKQVLALYGIPVVQERLVLGADEVVAAGAALGYPLVVKIESPDIPHKTEAGMVVLNVGGPDELRGAVQRILDRANAMTPRPRLNGVVLQPMIPKGTELVIGGLVDKAFGPMVIFGFGGVLVELLRDSVTAIAPISPREAELLLKRLSGYRLLQGYRDTPAVDIALLATTISRVSQFIADQREMITELDINPLIATADGLVAVDALIVRADAAEDKAVAGESHHAIGELAAG